jgi:hypothetical protein
VYGIIAFVGYAADVWEDVSVSALPPGIISLIGYAVTPTFEWLGNSPVGTISFIGYGEAPSGQTLSQSIPEPITGIVLFYGYASDVVNYATLLPGSVFPGYSSDGVNISFPIALLPGVSAEEADVVIGDWRKIFQGMCLRLDTYIRDMSPVVRPQTISTFLLENWNAKSPLFEYGYGNKRIFHVSFNINYAFQKIKDEVQ